MHILSVQLDLCNLETVRDAARQLHTGTLSTPAGDTEWFTPLTNVRIPRLDSVIFNAGIGGFTALDWPKLIRNFLVEGCIEATTWPTFKVASHGSTVAPAPSTSPSSTLGEIFCANVFGHYMFAHALLSLLTRSSSTTNLPPARIIWESSVEGDWDSHSLSDFQGLSRPFAYESSKRLTDILCLTAALPASQPFVNSYLTPTDNITTPQETEAVGEEKTTRPRIYVVHPGVVQTTIFPVNAFLFFWYRVVLYFVRWIGSPWHPITTYNGAKAAVWVALQEQTALDAECAERVKWGSATDRAGNCFVKKTEVAGWGWDGRVTEKGYEEECVVGVLRRAVGRRSGAVDLTEDKFVEFQEVGAACWKEMERLRVEWEVRLYA